MTEDERDFEIIQFSLAPTDGLAALLRIIDRRIATKGEVPIPRWQSFIILSIVILFLFYIVVRIFVRWLP